MRRTVLFAAAVVFAWVTPASAAKVIPLISTTQVHRLDPVSAKTGKPGEVGTVEYAIRDGDVVHYFASAEHCAEYLHNPGKYPDAGAGHRVAFLGADPVARFPQGVRSPAIGNVVNGNPNMSATFEGAMFWFASKEDKNAFLKKPGRYVPPVGGYCLGAMSAGHVVPGDPRNAFYIPEVGTWAVFGSMKGPVAFAKMTSKQRVRAYWSAMRWYKRLTRRKHVAQK